MASVRWSQAAVRGARRRAPRAYSPPPNCGRQGCLAGATEAEDARADIFDRDQLMDFGDADPDKAKDAAKDKAAKAGDGVLERAERAGIGVVEEAGKEIVNGAFKRGKIS